MLNKSIFIFLVSITLIACGGGSDSSSEGNSDQTSGGSLPLKESHFLHKMMTTTVLDIHGNAKPYQMNMRETDYFFYENNDVEVFNRSITQTTPKVVILKWEVENDILYVNNGTRTTGAIYEAPTHFVFSSAPEMGSKMLYMTGVNSVYVDKGIIAFRDIEARIDVSLSEPDFSGWTYEFDFDGDPNGVMLTTVEFFDDGTATYKPGIYGAVQTVKWKMTDSSNVQLYDFKYAPTYKTYTFKQFPTVGDEVDRTQMLNERLSEDSTFLVNRYRTL